MKKILILGISGAGKSTLARQLGKKLNIQVIHLDAQFWKPRWEMPEAEEWENCLKVFAEKDSWVIDGNYVSSYPILMPRADLIIILDFERSIAIYRVVKRVLMARLGFLKLDDAPKGCPQKIDKLFLSYIWNFQRDRRPLIDSALEEFTKSAVVYIFKTPAQVQKFLSAVAEL